MYIYRDILNAENAKFAEIICFHIALFEYLLITDFLRALRELCVIFYYPVSNFITVNSF